MLRQYWVGVRSELRFWQYIGRILVRQETYHLRVIINRRLRR